MLWSFNHMTEKWFSLKWKNVQMCISIETSPMNCQRLLSAYYIFFLPQAFCHAILWCVQVLYREEHSHLVLVWSCSIPRIVYIYSKNNFSFTQNIISPTLTVKVQPGLSSDGHSPNWKTESQGWPFIDVPGRFSLPLGIRQRTASLSFYLNHFISAGTWDQTQVFCVPGRVCFSPAHTSRWYIMRIIMKISKYDSNWDLKPNFWISCCPKIMSKLCYYNLNISILCITLLKHIFLTLDKTTLFRKILQLCHIMFPVFPVVCFS